VLMAKFEKNLGRVFASRQRAAILHACLDQQRLEGMAVNEFMDLLAV